MVTMLNELLRWQESKESTKGRHKVKEGIPRNDLA